MKRITRSGVVFSSEDSADTDESMVSSIDAKDAARDKSGNQVLNLREQINKLFLAEPELIDHIKFEKLKEEDGFPLATNPKKEENKLFDSRSPSPQKKATPGTILSLANLDDSLTDNDEKNKKPQLSSKYWDVINKEMIKTAKQKALPSIKRINHILNIYKTKLDYNDNIPETSSPHTKQTPRYGSAQGGPKDKKLLNVPKVKGKNEDPPLLNVNPEHLDDAGVQVYSFKRKMQLQFKNRRERLSKEKSEASQIEKSPVLMSMEQQSSVKRIEGRSGSVETPKADVLASTQSLSQLRSVSRQGTQKISLKGSTTAMGVVERLTKSNVKKDEVVMIDGKEFKSFKARELYLERQKATDFEGFKRDAVKRIKQTKREFYDKVQASKPVVPDSIKFMKDKNSRLNNLLMPEFDKAVKFNEKEKESIFALDDGGGSEDRQNEREMIAKMSKLFNGNIQHVWKVYQNESK